ncbi:MAG: PIN domain-containing protein [Candidatus Marsarchaeota archaeon]|nr:PIN domain-containing protein [Candidatus Marsarchaeota archaeon]
MSSIMSSMNYIIIDTSSILFGLKFNKNVFEIVKERYIGNYKIIISRSIINELERLSSAKSRLALNAKLALSIISLIKENERKVFIYKDSNINTDKWISSMLGSLSNLVIVTNDTQLAKALSDKSKTYINKSADIFKITKQGVLKKFQ